MISNRILIIFFGVGLILNFFEFFIFYKNFLMFLFVKIFILLITFFFSLLLFSLRVIGGGDGKLIIIIFIIHPSIYLKTSYLVLFFLILSFLFLIFFFTNYLNNNFTKNSSSFDILFNLGIKVSIFKKVFIKMAYNFFYFSKIINYQGIKKLIRSKFIIYNSRTNKLQYLAQYKLPIILYCILSYYFLLFLKIGMFK